MTWMWRCVTVWPAASPTFTPMVELLVEEGFCLPDEGEESGEFCIGRIEEAGDVAEGDEEKVAGAACRCSGLPALLLSWLPGRG